MANNTIRLTMAQALVKYLSPVNTFPAMAAENRFFAGMWGIFGHGNVAGVGQALEQYAPDLRYYQSRNEQAQVLASVAYAKHKNRLSAFACASSIGPGATNMITGAAVATVNRIPVLLLPGDIFAERIQAPVLQQLESEHTSGHKRQRLLQAGLALLGSHLSARTADYGIARGDARADIAGRYRRGHAGAASGCAGGSA